jgi:hypothetical protein
MGKFPEGNHRGPLMRTWATLQIFYSGGAKEDGGGGKDFEGHVGDRLGSLTGDDVGSGSCVGCRTLHRLDRGMGWRKKQLS